METWAHRGWLDRTADRRKPDQERLSVVGYRPARSPSSKKSAALQVALPPTSAPKRTWCSRAFHRGGARDSCKPERPHQSARAGQIIVELGYIPFLTRSVRRSACGQGGDLSRRRGQRHAGNGGGRKAVIYLAGNKEARAQAEPTCADLPNLPLFRAIGAASRSTRQHLLVVSTSPRPQKRWRWA